MDNSENSNNKNTSLNLIADYGASDSESDETETQSNENTGNDDSDAAEISQMVLKNNIINACAHGPLSKPNVREDVDTTRHMIIDSLETGVIEYEVTEYRDVDSDTDSTSSDSSDSDVDSVKDIEDISSCDEIEITNQSKKAEPPRVQGELGLDDLPPIEDLAISLPAQETTQIGTIVSIVDRLVIVRALPETPAVDLDSILFLDNGSKALGKVFDVFGPVKEPHYCVRFNSQDHVKERGVEPGMEVYIAPRTQHTSYVFLSDLMKTKGSDASWLNDVEPPPNQIEYSDDEEERRANKARKEQQRLNKQDGSDVGETSRNQPRKTQENRKNQRPSEYRSRFGTGPPNRGRNPFSAGSRRNPASLKFPKQWSPNMGLRMPPPHPNNEFNCPPHSAPPFPTNCPIFPPVFHPNTPPPFMGNSFQFGANPRMPPMIPMMGPPFRHNAGPVFGSNFCNMGGPQPRWVNDRTPPPSGT